MKVIVNGETKETDKTHLNYWDAVMLAFGEPKMALQTITYYARGSGDNYRSGIISPHKPGVEICEGMRFNICYTGDA